MAHITYDDETRSWLLATPSSSYALGIAAHGTTLRHLHWGPLIGIEDLQAFARSDAATHHSGRVAWADETPAEAVAWGGPRFDEPSLKVEFADGTRGVEWEQRGHRITAEPGSASLVVELVDRVYPLTIELGYRVFDDSDVIERWTRLSHHGLSGPITVDQLYAANWWLPRRESWRLRYLHGGWSSEMQIAEAVLSPGKLVLESRRGTTSPQLNPWFSLDPDSSATEEHGDVYSGALAWSGSWKLVVETTPGGSVHTVGGWNEFDSPLRLEPGEEIVTPVFAGAYTAGGLGEASRTWHAYQLAHVLTQAGRSGGSPSFPPPEVTDGSEAAGTEVDPSPRLRPVLYNSWEATTFSVNEQNQAALAELAAAMGVELFVVDDGWFVGRNDDHAGLGDWVVDPAKFPRGLDALIKRVHGLGMGFGLWVEPEMVNPNSDLYRRHPDWVLHFEHRARTQRRNQLVLNLARPDVAEWVYETLHRLLSEHDITFIKWDMNRHFSEPGWPAQVGRNPERVWVGHVRGIYSVLDQLRASHPDVHIESCSGGGGRIDLGILARTQQVWPSDNTDAWDRIAIQEGFTQAYAPLTMTAWVTDSPNPLTRRQLSLRYRFHVAMAGTLGIGGNLAAWSEHDRIEAAELIEEYKAIRPLIQLGRLYRLASTRSGQLGAVEYLRTDGGEIAVLAWWGVRHFGVLPARLRLAGLDPGGVYRDTTTGEQRSGAQLMELGIALPEGLDFESILVHLIRMPGPYSN